jgi:hypothetical protein
MKKIWLFLSLLICSIFLIWCSEEIPEFDGISSRSCGVYNKEYPVRWGANDWIDLTVAVRSWTKINYIKNIIWKKYICYEWTNSLKSHRDELPDDAIWYRFSLRIYPNNEAEKEKITKIEQDLENDDNVYEVRTLGYWYN